MEKLRRFIIKVLFCMIACYPLMYSASLLYNNASPATGMLAMFYAGMLYETFLRNKVEEKLYNLLFYRK